MTNKNYIKGVKKERMYVNQARAKGLISFRSAGSHSPVDVVIIDIPNNVINLIQCKPSSMSNNKKKIIKDKYNNLNSSFLVTFDVV